MIDEEELVIAGGGGGGTTDNVTQFKQTIQAEVIEAVAPAAIGVGSLFTYATTAAKKSLAVEALLRGAPAASASANQLGAFALDCTVCQLGKVKLSAIT
ncbi:TPA: hypothetical protein DCZ36_03405 [Candidatus Gracilibacteria bacterium]|nr:hypothetical protein [Candidatus Gracilibacteria bacterium]